MEIEIKLIPIFDADKYFVDVNNLKIGVQFTYEDKDRLYQYNVSGGLPINGRMNIEDRKIMYFVGENCSIEQFKGFINNLNKRLPANITICENEGSKNIIEFDPLNSIWRHTTESIDHHFGGSLTIKLTNEMIKQYTNAFENYYMFAFMQIEGHKRLYEVEHSLMIDD